MYIKISIKTSKVDGSSKEVDNEDACIVSSTTSCCATLDTTSDDPTRAPCNQVTSCNNPKGDGTIKCDNTAANKDYGCAVKYIYNF